jgi:hypothetical protein
MKAASPDFWGPSAWRFIHAVSFTYPNNPTQEEKKQYIDFILNLQNILPCFACREHLKHNLRDLNFNIEHMKNRKTFSKFTVDLHNMVNRQLGKSIKHYEEVKRQY